MTAPSGPLINFMEFVDPRQRMLLRFRTHIDRISLADPQPLDGTSTEELYWPQCDFESRVLWRLHGRNRRELARSTRTFVSVEKAQLNANALMAAGERLQSHVVHIDDEYSWCLSLFGTPVLLGVRWYPDAEQAVTASETAKHELAHAVAHYTKKRLTVAATGPLSVDSGSSKTGSASRHPHKENELPTSTDLTKGSRD